MRSLQFIFKLLLSDLTHLSHAILICICIYRRHFFGFFVVFFFAIGSNYTDDNLCIENSTAREKRVLFINYSENKYLFKRVYYGRKKKHNNDKNKTHIHKKNLQISQHKNKKLLKGITEQQYLERSLLFIKLPLSYFWMLWYEKLNRFRNEWKASRICILQNKSGDIQSVYSNCYYHDIYFFFWRWGIKKANKE